MCEVFPSDPVERGDGIGGTVGVRRGPRCGKPPDGGLCYVHGFVHHVVFGLEGRKKAWVDVQFRERREEDLVLALVVQRQHGVEETPGVCELSGALALGLAEGRESPGEPGQVASRRVVDDVVHGRRHC